MIGSIATRRAEPDRRPLPSRELATGEGAEDEGASAVTTAHGIGMREGAGNGGVAGTRGGGVVGAVDAPLRPGAVAEVAAPLRGEAVGTVGVGASVSGGAIGATGVGFSVFGFSVFGFSVFGFGRTGFGRFGFGGVDGVLVCCADVAAGGVAFRGRSGAPPNCARALPAHASTTSQDAPTARADPIAQR